MSDRVHKLLLVRTPLLLCGAFLLSAPGGAPLEMVTPRLPLDVGACVTLEEVEVSEQEVEARLNSTCASLLRCQVSWTISCTGSASPSQHMERFALRSGESAGVMIDGGGCPDDDWEVEVLNWACAQH